MRYSLRTLLTLLLIFSIVLSWFVDHRRLVTERDRISQQLAVEMQRNLISAASYDSRLAETARLVESDDPHTVPLLLFALTDPDSRIRKTALDQLSTIRLDDRAKKWSYGGKDPWAEAEILFWIDVINRVWRERQRTPSG